MSLSLKHQGFATMSLKLCRCLRIKIANTYTCIYENTNIKGIKSRRLWLLFQGYIFQKLITDNSTDMSKNTFFGRIKEQRESRVLITVQQEPGSEKDLCHNIHFYLLVSVAKAISQARNKSRLLGSGAWLLSCCFLRRLINFKMFLL